MDKQTLKQIRARCEAATPGEWVTPPTFTGVCSQSGDILFTPIKLHNHINNMLFIQNARQDIPALLDYIAELEEQLENAVEVVRCRECRYKNKQLCRASVRTKHNPKTEKWSYKTMMEDDGFCHIGERR